MGDDRRWKKVSAGELGSYSAMELGIKQRRRQGTAPHRRRDCIYKVCAPRYAIPWIPPGRNLRLVRLTLLSSSHGLYPASAPRHSLRRP